MIFRARRADNTEIEIVGNISYNESSGVYSITPFGDTDAVEVDSDIEISFDHKKYYRITLLRMCIMDFENS